MPACQIHITCLLLQYDQWAIHPVMPSSSSTNHCNTNIPQHRQCISRSPTKIEAERLHSFIGARSKEIEMAIEGLDKEREKLEMTDIAIARLEADIPKGKALLATNENKLTSLMSLRSHLNSMDEVSQQEMAEQSPVNGSQYLEIQDCLGKTGELTLDLIDNYIENLKNEIRNLWDKVHQLETELIGWQFSKTLSEKAIKRLETSRDDLLEELKYAKYKFRSIWKVPSEVWTRIFEYAIQHATDSYLDGNPECNGMRPPIFNLSQVCQRWRYLVHNDPTAWRLVYVAPHRAWRYDEYDLVTQSLRKSSMPITVLTNICQEFCWSYDSIHRRDPKGYYLSCVWPNEETIFNGKDYTLLLNVNHDNNDYMKRLLYIPLLQPSSLIFYGQSNFRYNDPFRYTSRFSNVKSFSIINQHPIRLPSPKLSSHFPKLRELVLQMKTFPLIFNLEGYLASTLQELRLRHNGGGPSPILSSDIELPHLRVVEITPPGSYLLDRLKAKALRSLTLYGPHDSTLIQLSYSKRATDIYGQLLYLKFEDWKEESIELGAVAVLKDIIDKTPSLCILTFSQSFVYGETLVSMIEATMGESADPTKRGNLREIILSYPTGITNAQCEELKKLVNSVKIYM
jgi:hypothetical protein